MAPPCKEPRKKKGNNKTTIETSITSESAASKGSARSHEGGNGATRKRKKPLET